MIQEIIIKVEFIQDLIAENPNHTAVKVNNLLFGNVEDRPQVGIAGKKLNNNADLLAAGFLAQLFVCFLVLQNWKICKWIQIRNQTSHM